MPAKVEGSWKLPEGELTLKQSFQMITGTLKAGGKETAIKGRLRGDHISFKAGVAQYSGRVGASGIKGTVKSGSSTGGVERHTRRKSRLVRDEGGGMRMRGRQLVLYKPPNPVTPYQ